jgi:hypothetical protein
VRKIVTCHIIPSFFSSALEFFTWVSREVPLAKVLFHLRHILAWDLLVVFCMVYRTVRSISQHARQNLSLALVLALYILPREVSAMESNSGGGAASKARDLAAATTCVAGVGKEAHRVQVQTRVRFQRRGFRSPIRARTPDSESKEESDLLWTRESESN